MSPTGGKNVIAEPAIVLEPDSEFYELFPNGIVPVKSFYPVRFGLFEGEENIGYFADLDRIPVETISALVEIGAERVGATPSYFRTVLMGTGMPIRLSRVVAHPDVTQAPRSEGQPS